MRPRALRASQLAVDLRPRAHISETTSEATATLATFPRATRSPKRLWLRSLHLTASASTAEAPWPSPGTAFLASRWLASDERPSTTALRTVASPAFVMPPFLPVRSPESWREGTRPK